MNSKTFTFKNEVHDALMGIAYRRGEKPETILHWAVSLMQIVDEEYVKGHNIVAVDKDGNQKLLINVF